MAGRGSCAWLIRSFFSFAMAANIGGKVRSNNPISAFPVESLPPKATNRARIFS